MTTGKSKSLGATVLTLAVLGLLLALRGGWDRPESPSGPQPSLSSAGGSGPGVIGRDASGIEAGESEILELYRARSSDRLVQVRARVDRMLPDDDDGSRHQRFILRFERSGHTLLVSHNIDLAPRVPVSEGSWVTVRGEYEWTDRGGVVHWTHHNPNRNPRHPGGWIEHDGIRYE